MFRFAILSFLCVHAHAIVLRHANATAVHDASAKSEQVVTFPGFYNSHHTGRGIWKWSNSLDAYQRHFAPFVGKDVALAEVGVQSGGSILLWQAVLGSKCHVYGLDINPACKQFADDRTTIVIGDQGDPAMWDSFFGTVKELDILIDDGSHEAPHMKVTLDKVFPHIKPGGYLSMEDIHGRNYVQSFFWPAAKSIGDWHAQQMVASLHIYPFQLMLLREGGSNVFKPDAIVATVNSFPALWPALTYHPGKFIAFENADWGSFLSENSLRHIFEQFAPLHDFNMWSDPNGCHTTSAAVCTTGIRNSNSQQLIIGVHVYAERFVVEVAAAPPAIRAVRKGTEWIAYR